MHGRREQKKGWRMLSEEMDDDMNSSEVIKPLITNTYRVFRRWVSSCSRSVLSSMVTTSIMLTDILQRTPSRQTSMAPP